MAYGKNQRIPGIQARYEILDGLRGIAALMVLLFPLIVVAWGLLKAYDLPVREWLKEHWLKR